MRNEIEMMILKHGPYWLSALAGVAIQKMFADTPSSLFKIFRSVCGAVCLSTLVVINFETYFSFSKMCAIIFSISLSVDLIIPKLLQIGPQLFSNLIKMITGTNK